MMRDRMILSLKVELKKSGEPLPDIAICSSCGWSGDCQLCGTETEGDWEGGYYEIDICPVCPDGGCIDDYTMSEERAAEWQAWNEATAQADAEAEKGE